MAYKLIVQWGALAGITMCQKEEKVLASENLGRKGFPILEESHGQFSFLAAHNCSLALQRGFYFSLRMPDWAKDFKQQTQKILAHGFEPLTMNSKSKDSKRSKYYGDHRSEHYDILFEDIPQEMQIPDPTKSRRPVRSPKIKDDFTCGKRVSP
ncbi:uncharacterized protein LOC128254336 [Drosophila gunungcola]|uniref:Uncharacterized protein n=1 Tax=Drosophila gunungcola TaxID=103775 RepID=A0A9P9YN25_9MUSC|nr:uncharacterized protein LOC128254336 [Drosophila gunungcola]KAI8039653.1 hypothetical protein M5D96_007073 [Drosophila gunungcola]